MLLVFTTNSSLYAICSLPDSPFVKVVRGLLFAFFVARCSVQF